MKSGITLLFILTFNLLFSQNPGNIGTSNLTAWFKPDNLAIGNVTNWTTTFPVGTSSVTVSDNTAPYPLATNTPLNNTSNYNTTIEFSANSNTAIKALQNTNSLNLLDNSASTSQGTFFGVYYFPTFIRNNNHMMLYNEAGSDAIQFRNLNAVGRFATGRGLGINTNASRDWTESNLPTIISYKGNRSGTGTLITKKNAITFTGGGASQSSGSIGLYFGLMPGNANSPFNGFLSEFIFYNRDLTALEINKVHSYLAIKYGITLENTGGGTQGDYLATDGTTIWDASTAPNYHNDVIGIGRDDNQSLLQKQSHSFYDVERLYIDFLQANNISNTGIINSDSSYVIMGNNGGLLCNTLSTGAELPPSPLFNSRIEREWKITKTNFAQNFSCDITISPCAIGVDFDTTCLALLVDDDGDFTNSIAYNSSNGLVFTKTGNTISVRGISDLHIPNNSTRYITLASVTFAKELGPDTTKCEGASINLDAGNAGANFSWNTGDTTQIIAVINPGMYWVRISSNGCFDYDTIVVYDQETNPLFFSLDTAGCVPLTTNFQDISSINSGTITNWDWTFGDGYTSTNQNPSNTYSTPGKYSVSLQVTSDLGCVSDTTFTNYISVFPYSESDFSFYPSFGNPRDIISFTNLSNIAVSYKWYFGDGDSSLLSDPTHFYFDEGTYSISLIAYNINGCNDTTSYNIEIKNELFFAPNSFTPGEDGKNDEWAFVGLPDLDSYELIIFNRWGEEIFRSTNPTENWNGKYKGVFVQTGIYTWKLTSKTIEGKTTLYQGHINVLKSLK